MSAFSVPGLCLCDGARSSSATSASKSLVILEPVSPGGIVRNTTSETQVDAHNCTSDDAFAISRENPGADLRNTNRHRIQSTTQPQQELEQ